MPREGQPHFLTVMDARPTMNVADWSPWPPVLYGSPMVDAGIDAAAALAFGDDWTPPQTENREPRTGNEPRTEN
jgi:hypothetical protein